MRHLKLREERAKLLQKRINTPVCGKHEGKYSYECYLIERVCELERIAEGLIESCEGIARLMGFGDEYNKICDLSEKLNQYHEKALNSTTKGRDWGDFPPTVERRGKAEKYTGEIFGRSQDEIARNQGIKKLK